MTIDHRAECQANRCNPASECKRCGRKIGQGCGEAGPFMDDAIAAALEDAVEAERRRIAAAQAAAWRRA